MDDIETAELPELEKEHRRDRLNTLVAITVTLLVTFMAICKLKDNNLVLMMQKEQADKIDNWSWFQSLNLREDINAAKLEDLRENLGDEDNAARKKSLGQKIAFYEPLTKKIVDKKEAVKKKAEENEKRYEALDEIHEQFDHTEGAISIAVSLLAITSLAQKRWLYLVSLIPAFAGIVIGSLALMW